MKASILTSERNVVANNELGVADIAPLYFFHKVSIWRKP